VLEIFTFTRSYKRKSQLPLLTFSTNLIPLRLLLVTTSIRSTPLDIRRLLLQFQAPGVRHWVISGPDISLVFLAWLMVLGIINGLAHLLSLVLEDHGRMVPSQMFQQLLLILLEHLQSGRLVFHPLLLLLNSMLVKFTI